MTDPHPTPPPSFFTFGMFIVDDIEWLSPDSSAPTKSLDSLPGGAGPYATLGARLLSPPPHLSQSITHIIDQGSDFPSSVTGIFNSWNTDCRFRYDESRLTSRAWNGYGDNEMRGFKYLTSKRRLDVEDLDAHQLTSQSFHMVCSPSRCQEITRKLAKARSKLLLPKPSPSPIIIWEPIPDLCSPEELINLQHAAQQCTVISPNHEELKMFFPSSISESLPQADLVKTLMGWDKTQPTTDRASRTPTSSSSAPICVVREGANGSTAYIPIPIPIRHKDPPTTTTTTTTATLHVPAYHTPTMSNQVIDPTGGGNTYLGGLAIALTDALRSQSTHALITSAFQLSRDDRGSHGSDETRVGSRLVVERVFIAMICATLAASYAIEQHGLPVVDGAEGIYEKWNGEAVLKRLRGYLDREADSLGTELLRTREMIETVEEGEA